MTRHATIEFTAADQRRFAKLSGDFNPVHLDPLAARRIVAGEAIVHGMHLLLHALDLHLARRPAPEAIAVAATFLRPAFLNEPIGIESHDDGRVSMHADGLPLVSATVAPASEPTSIGSTTSGTSQTVAVIRAARGGRLFPRLTRVLGPDVVASIAAISNVVGMKCPGRHSLLSAVRLDLTAHARASRLAWQAIRRDDRFGLVRLAVTSDAVRGTVDAFERPAPAALPTAAEAAAHVAAEEFAGQRALIVGGSRGLGAATAMLVAAGGGLPIVTFAAGAREAAALKRDARFAGRAIETLRFDVARDEVKVLARAATRFGVTHLYYFATPRIFARRRDPFDDALFRRFTEFYVDAFARVCAAVRGAAPSLSVFYPSSTAIDDGPAELTEYAAAKAAGEALCRQLNRANDGLRVVVRRLPRVSTDQTASILRVPALDPLEAALPVVREMQGHNEGLRG
jgi:NAD(P)-dependent dehydrogenase (short-subunit alcohol dehydrogenase family)